MKTTLLSASAVVATILSATQSFAADPYVDAPFDWTGLYVGAEAGFRNLEADVSLPALAGADAQPSLNDFSLGGEIGYRYQLENQLVLGISADAAALLGGKDSDELTGFPGNFWQVDSDWNASIQASVGWAFDRALFYGMGGVAFTDISGCGTFGGACAAGTDFSGTRAGWTVGAGVAFAWTDHWISNVEYHYADYGSKTYTTPGAVGGSTDVDLKSHAVTAGLQYRF